MAHKDDESAREASALALLSSVTSGLSTAREPRLLRQRFEEQLRAIVQARSVAVRETPPDLSCPPAVVSVDLPSARGRRRLGSKRASIRRRRSTTGSAARCRWGRTSPPC